MTAFDFLKWCFQDGDHWGGTVITVWIICYCIGTARKAN